MLRNLGLQRKFDKLLFFYLFIWVGNFSQLRGLLTYKAIIKCVNFYLKYMFHLIHVAYDLSSLNSVFLAG